MRLIKFTHACVRLENEGRGLLLDPGTWAEDAAFDAATDILVTHEHADHVDVDRIVAAHGRSPLTVYAPGPVAEMLGALGSAVRTVTVGEEFTAAGFHVKAVGGKHAVIFNGIPDCANVGYVVDGAVYHPGDSLFIPDVAVQTLLVPTAAPWLKLAEAIEFLRAVGPTRAFSIHDAMLSARGEAGVDRWLSQTGGTDYGRLPPGEGVDI